MCDAFLVLAQADGGLSCFLMPRFTPDGERNRIHIQRLKDKLGNRSNASSEVEFRGAWARMVGEEGRGVPTIIEMVNHTRLDCALGAAAGMRAGTAHAIHHAAAPRGLRQGAGRPAADAERARRPRGRVGGGDGRGDAAGARLRRGRSPATSAEAEFKRIANAVLKYWLCKRAPTHAAEALECFGGNGYVEESGMPRLYRESPLNSIWEGSGNVQCLDVLRAMVRGPEALEAFFAEVAEAAGADPRLDAAAAALRDELADLDAIEARARRVVERMALALQGSLLVRFGDPAVADAFCAIPPRRRLGPRLRHPAGRRRLRSGSSSATPPDRRRGSRSEPALVEAPDQRLAEADRVGERAVVDVLGRCRSASGSSPAASDRSPSTGSRSDSRRKRLEPVGAVSQPQVRHRLDPELVGEPVDQRSASAG